MRLCVIRIALFDLKTRSTPMSGQLGIMHPLGDSKPRLQMS